MWEFLLLGEERCLHVRWAGWEGSWVLGILGVSLLGSALA